MNTINQKYWVLTADMGYGHQRATDPFAGVARYRIINMNNDVFTPKAEQKYWDKVLWAYEFISRAAKVPLIGSILFRMLNSLLRIPKQNSGVDFRRPTYQVKLLKLQIRRGLCRGVVDKIKSEPAPVITSFYAPAIAADMAGIPDIYCIICDSDLNRVWVSDKPDQTNIKYFTPCPEATERLKSYGVPEKNIVQTGFPLHPDLSGNKNLEVAKSDFCKRIHRLLPENRSDMEVPDFCKDFLKMNIVKPGPITISFAVGGAGAQTDWAAILLKSFEALLIAENIKINLIAGVREEVRDGFLNLINDRLKGRVDVIFEWEKNAYFKRFNQIMRETDLLITKPSELSFYAGLGLPVLMTQPLGSQEDYNRRWLLKNKAAIDLPKAGSVTQWFTEKLENGTFAQLAINGFQNIEKAGYYHIMDYLNGKSMPTRK